VIISQAQGARPGSPPTPMASLGPLKVEAGSMTLLRGAMVVALATVALLAVGLLALALKLGQARKRAAQLEQQHAELRASLAPRGGGTGSFVSRAV
jgi:hypothetical protein